jgi:hypothetical protein
MAATKWVAYTVSKPATNMKSRVAILLSNLSDDEVEGGSAPLIRGGRSESGSCAEVVGS